MREYRPDRWVVLRIESEDEVLYKVLGGWSGGYLDGDSWRMNSGIAEVKADSDGYFFFYGFSGSCYTCHKESYGLSMATAGICDKLVKKFGDKIKLMPEDTDWRHLI